MSEKYRVTVLAADIDQILSGPSPANCPVEYSDAWLRLQEAVRNAPAPVVKEDAHDRAAIALRDALRSAAPPPPAEAVEAAKCCEGYAVDCEQEAAGSHLSAQGREWRVRHAYLLRLAAQALLSKLGG